MDQDKLKFELLKRFGNVQEVHNLLIGQDASEEQKTVDISETYLHSLIRWPIGTREDIGPYRELDADEIEKELKFPELERYLNNTHKWDIITEFIDAVGGEFERYVVDPPCETYDPLSLLGFLNHDPLLRSIERGREENTPLKTASNNLVKRAYQILFTHDINDEWFNLSYPKLEKWGKFVDPLELIVLATQSLAEFFWDRRGNESDSNKDLFSVAIPSLVNLVGEEVVAQALYLAVEEKDRGRYQVAVDAGYVPDGSKIVNIDREERIKGIRERNHQELHPQRSLEGRTTGKEFEKIRTGEEDYSHLFGEWFRTGQMGYLTFVMEDYVYTSNKSQLNYNLENARNSLGEAIADALEQQEWDKLKWVLNFHSDFIDRSNPRLAILIEAYDLTK